ncbi:TPA: hypothetical protein P7V30_001575 [Escherichia coli]|uniref:DUF6864 domain-containing function n=1 Tax=Escherichia coli TaxID=562 RepID=UPI00192C50E3|nr:hypothetical protein [Escherichia coli]EFO3229709.1 hypothetical protein [Escherichia coli]EHT4289197.1 hypothetical protein [Escherichia coli]ELU2842557.1 hypothetical protein [Escherichia coli]MBL7370896.1 hypothetical protein [Escherichia coli]MBL7418290.1 hypothetical protein [Escherichia coli]
MNDIVKETLISNRVVVYSKTLLVHNNDDRITLKMFDDKKFHMTFRYDDDDKSSRYEAGPSDGGQSYTVSFINFKNGLGEGILEPFPFYIVDNVQHYLTVWIQTVNKTSRVVIINIIKD